MEGAHLAAVGGDDSQISGDPVTTLHLHQITDHHVLSVDVFFLTVTDDQGLLRRDNDTRSANNVFLPVFYPSDYSGVIIRLKQVVFFS